MRSQPGDPSATRRCALWRSDLSTENQDDPSHNLPHCHGRNRSRPFVHPFKRYSSELVTKNRARNFHAPLGRDDFDGEIMTARTAADRDHPHKPVRDGIEGIARYDQARTLLPLFVPSYRLQVNPPHLPLLRESLTIRHNYSRPSASVASQASRSSSSAFHAFGSFRSD
jgi:hypothetical protein